MAKFQIDAEHPAFLRDLKQAKKTHPSLLREDLPACLREIEAQPDMWPRIPSLPAEIRKARIGVKSQGIGKSGGYRLIYLVNRDEMFIVLLALHYKPDIAVMPLEEVVRRVILRSRN